MRIYAETDLTAAMSIAIIAIRMASSLNRQSTLDSCPDLENRELPPSKLTDSTLRSIASRRPTAGDLYTSEPVPTSRRLEKWLRAFALTATACFTLLLTIGSTKALAVQGEICDVKADYALGVEDYGTAITLHRRLLRSQPNNALAHYHLGFAYGMTGSDSAEEIEYLKAARLGLRQWDLFLNLGLVYLEQRDWPNAANALETSARLGPDHPEAHFNLAIAYEQLGRLADAMKEIAASVRMAPADLDMRNTKAIICAEEGDLQCARDEWVMLTQMAPDYLPARANLAILSESSGQLHGSSLETIEIPQRLPPPQSPLSVETARTALDPDAISKRSRDR
jgi:Flp pilus assembly protein TadD